jgi:hypothetical protein
LTHNDFVLSWSARIDTAGSALSFDYRLENRGTDAAWALDHLLVFRGQGFAVDEDAALVLEDPAQAGRVRLVRGHQPPVKADPQIELRPVARSLPRGTALEGHGRIPWPLRHWHPNDGEWPLQAAARELVLEVGVLPARCTLESLPLEGGRTASVPRHADAFQFQLLVRATAPMPLPGP